MIRYALICADCETEFEAWFASSSAYDVQSTDHLIECPSCSGHQIGKQIMAPAVSTSKRDKSNTALSPAKLMEAARNHIAQTHDYTGSNFPDEARAMHYGEVEERPIWGETTAQEATALRDEGITALPLPGPLTPKPPKDKTELN